MINRRIARRLSSLLDESPAIALIGPRQVGKTTLALAIAEARPSIYLDLESEAARAKLVEPELYLMRHEDKLLNGGVKTGHVAAQKQASGWAPSAVARALAR